MFRSFVAPVRICAVLLTALPALALAGPGDFDTTFASNGKTAAGFDLSGGTKDDRGLMVIPLSDGKTLVVGTAKPNANSGAVRVGFMRFLANGLLDSSFGSQGKVTAETLFSTFCCAGVDNNNRIYVAGTFPDAQNGDAEFGVQRFLATGQGDASYGLFGATAASFDQGGNNNDVPRAMTVSPSGSVFLAGSVQFQTAGDTDFGLARFTDTGLLDTAFSDDGKATYSFDIDGLAADEATALSSYNPNTMRVAGTARRADGTRVVAVVSFITGSGVMVPAFCPGTSCQGAQQSLVTGPGRRTLRFDTLSGATDDLVTGATLSSDNTGRLGVVGVSVLQSGSFDTRGAFALIEANGQMLSTFQRGAAPEGGNNFGRVLISLGNPTYAFGVSHRNVDDHWIVAGALGNSPARYGYAAYVSSLPALDTSFTQLNLGGGPLPSAFQLIELPRNSDAVPIETVMASTAIDTQQRILVAGWRLWNRATGVEDNDFAIVRLSGNAGGDALFANGFE